MADRPPGLAETLAFGLMPTLLLMLADGAWLGAPRAELAALLFSVPVVVVPKLVPALAPIPVPGAPASGLAIGLAAAPAPTLPPRPCAKTGLAASTALHNSAGRRVLLRILFMALLSLEGEAHFACRENGASGAPFLGFRPAARPQKITPPV